MPKQPNHQPERRYLTQEFRVSAEGEAPKISGYAAVFDSPSEDLGWIEEVDPHAFDAVLAGKHDCRALWNHNPDHVLGRETAGTLHLSIDSRGLAYVIDAPATQLATDLMTSMRRKDIRESSFGFVTARDSWTDNPDGSVTRRILEIAELLDVSPVTYPAYTSTSSGVRSRAIPATCPAELRSKLVAKRSDDGDPNENGCCCSCDPCVANDCLNCYDPDCIDTNCLANQDESNSRSNNKRSIEQCTCICSQCRSGSCGICSADPQCEGVERKSNDTWQEDALLRLRIAEAE